MTFPLEVLAWLWAAKWVVLGIYLAALALVYVLFRFLLIYNAYRYHDVKDVGSSI